MSDEGTRIAAAMALTERIRPLLAGHHPMVQGAALADLLAIFLAGHDVPGDADATRAEWLAEHCRLVRELVPINARMIGTTP